MQNYILDSLYICKPWTSAFRAWYKINLLLIVQYIQLFIHDFN